MNKIVMQITDVAAFPPSVPRPTLKEQNMIKFDIAYTALTLACFFVAASI